MVKCEYPKLITQITYMIFHHFISIHEKWDSSLDRLNCTCIQIQYNYNNEVSIPQIMI